MKNDCYSHIRMTVAVARQALLELGVSIVHPIENEHIRGFKGESLEGEGFVVAARMSVDIFSGAPKGDILCSVWDEEDNRMSISINVNNSSEDFELTQALFLTNIAEISKVGFDNLLNKIEDINKRIEKTKSVLSKTHNLASSGITAQTYDVRYADSQDPKNGSKSDFSLLEF